LVLSLEIHPCLKIHSFHHFFVSCINFKITYEHDGQYHKGYLTKPDDTYHFSFNLHVNKGSEDWGVDLPNLAINWVDICVNKLLTPCHVSHMFLHSLLSPTSTTFDPAASFVRAVNLHLKCPPSLLKDLANSHADQETWLNSFFEEKQGIESLGTSRKITLGEYHALHEKGAPTAIPTMCIIFVKCNKNLLPLCAKSCIVVLGNHEDQVWSKSNRYAPVLWSNSLCFIVTMVVSKCPPLHQGNSKIIFCQGILPDNEITIV
jgi:hypothetical protein